MEESVVLIMIICFLISYFLGGAYLHITPYIESLQLILHLPIFNIVVPGNVKILFEVLFPVAFWDLLDKAYSTRLIFKFDDIAQKAMKMMMLPQMHDLGYES